MGDNGNIGRLLKMISDTIKAEADANLKKYDLSLAQLRTIKYVMRCGGSCTQKALETHFAVSHPTIVGIVSRLEKRGFVAVTVDSADRRNKIVSVTDKAREIDKELGEFFVRNNKAMFKGFTEEEIATLKALLDRAYENVSAAASQSECGCRCQKAAKSPDKEGQIGLDK